MPKKASKQKKLRILRITAVVLASFNALIWYGIFSYDVSAPDEFEMSGLPVSANISSDVTVSVVPERVGVPVRIIIPSISLDAAIEGVTLASDGSMEVPKHPDDVAWYALGPRPGEVGSAAIAGHVDWMNGATAVFADLHKVKTGDKIMIQDDKGDDILFVARETRKYGAEADATDVFSSNDGIAHLNIITCNGVWDKRAKQYTGRLVVFAEMEME